MKNKFRLNHSASLSYFSGKFEKEVLELSIVESAVIDCHKVIDKILKSSILGIWCKSSSPSRFPYL